MWLEHFERPDGSSRFLRRHLSASSRCVIAARRLKKKSYLNAISLMSSQGESPVSETWLSPQLSSDLSFMVATPLQSSVAPAQLSEAKPSHGNTVPQSPLFSLLTEGACVFHSPISSCIIITKINLDHINTH